jgi:signal peptidase I
VDFYAGGIILLKSSHEKIKKQMEPPEPLTKKSFFREWVLPLGTEVLVLFVLLKFIFMINFVPTESMWPTFPAHSALFSTRVFYKENIERGDVLVFRSDETGKVLIKRCIGLPGETVTVGSDGSVRIDGTLLAEPYVSSDSDYSGVFEVPEGCYLFFGDNRGDSLDARYWQEPYISEDKLMGKALFVLWPIGSFGTLE